MRSFQVRFVGATLIAMSGFACNSGSTSSNPASTNSASHSLAEVHLNPPERTDPQRTPSSPKRRMVAPVEIGVGEKPAGLPSKSDRQQPDSVRAALKPFQVLLGRWNSLSRKAIADRPEWAYDWVSDPNQPGLRVLSEKGVYVRNGRLSYLPETDQFEFKATDAEGALRTFRGTFTEPIRDVASDEKKLQRTYKLQLTELEANSAGEQWRMTFNQQENNRYILEIDRKRGNGPFSRIDTIHTQREGTSFALSETDYGDKTCIISQGLGTISVSFKGQTFWVCCSGCKAAFEDDPEKWIAKWEEKKKSSK